MAEFDIGEFKEKFSVEFFSRMLREGVDAAKDFFERVKKQIWKDVDIGELRLDKDGELHTTIEGKEVNITEMRRALDDGEFKKFFDKCGVEGDYNAQIEKLQKEYDETPNAKTKALKKEYIDGGKKIEDKLGENFKPKDVDELVKEVRKAYGDEVADKIKDKADKFDELKKELDKDTIEKAKDKPAEEQKGMLEKVYDFVCGGKGGFSCLLRIFQLCVLAALIYLAVDFVDWLNKISHAMSGCWSYMGTGNSDPSGSGNCKIAPLTCNKSDTSTSTGTKIFPDDFTFSLCTACTTNINDPACKGQTKTWIPIVTANFCSCIPNNSNYLSGYQSFDISSPASNTGQNVCQTKCGKPAPPDGITSACPQAAGCVAWNEACATGNTQNSDCSNWCGTQVQNIPGQVIKCQQCNFSCALAAAAGDIFRVPSDLLGQIEKILLWVALGIVILVVGYMGLRFFFGIVGSMGGGGKKKEETIKIDLTQSGNKMVTAAFSRGKKKY